MMQEEHFMFWTKNNPALRKALFFASVPFGLCFLFPLKGHSQQEVRSSVDDTLICSQMIELAERSKRIPRGLLEAIARVESGKLVPDLRLTKPWPWTVTADGVGKFYPTKQGALAAIEQFKRDGIDNIDVGCMQVNLLYHGDGFASYNEALDPINNVAYATEFLFALFQRHRNWDQAVRFYHSSDPEKHNNYLANVVDAWQSYDEPVPLPLKLSPDAQRIEQERLAFEKAQEQNLQNLSSRKTTKNPLAKENEVILKSKLFADRLRRSNRIIPKEDKDAIARARRERFENQDDRSRIKPGKNPRGFIDALEESF
jgi:hypothetical protein